MSRTEPPTTVGTSPVPDRAWHPVRDRVAQLVAVEVARQLADVEVPRADGAGRSDRDFTVDLLLGAGTRVDRTVHPGHWATLLRQIEHLTGAGTDVSRAARRAFVALLEAEARGLGRVAGSTYNIVGKLVTPPLLGTPEGAVLEIGTLFGLFSPLLVRQFRQAGSFRALTVLDPFAGTQLQRDATVPLDHTGTPVTEQVARQNLLDLGVAAADLTMINGFSGETEVRQALRTQRFALAVVDGDHGEDGVYADLCWVEEIVAPGGLVVVDDFGDRLWPGVERATRRYLADRDRFELLGTVSTSAYLRARP